MHAPTAKQLQQSALSLVLNLFETPAAESTAHLLSDPFLLPSSHHSSFSSSYAPTPPFYYLPAVLTGHKIAETRASRSDLMRFQLTLLLQ